MFKKYTLPLLFSVFFLFALLVPQLDAKASPAIICVPEDYATIQEAINEANSGDIIQVSAGTYNEILFINKTLSLIGEDKNNTIIEGFGGECTVIQASLTSVNISGFTIKYGDNGIKLENCTNSMIYENDIIYTCKGIWLHYSNNNTVLDNTLSDSWWCGILLCGHSSKNTITRNIVRDNPNGLGLTGEGNLIYHNNFINNQNQTIMIESFHNAWNSTYEGNHWSNYNGTDANQDGIGDVPYRIDEKNQDNHPLMGKFSQFKIQWREQNYTVSTICNSTITNFDFGTIFENAISFNVAGPEGTRGFCRIIAPYALLDGNCTIRIDDASPIIEKELPLSNSTHTYLYFTYTHTAHQVIITPEFLTTIILPLLIILALIAAAASKKVSSKQQTKRK